MRKEDQQVMDPTELLKSCRLCLLQGGGIFDIFSTQSVLHRLMDILSLKMTETDGFPRRICQVCLDKLGLSHSFKHQALASHDKLCSLLNVDISCEGNVKTEPEIEVKEEFLNEIENVQYNAGVTKPEDLSNLGYVKTKPGIKVKEEFLYEIENFQYHGVTKPEDLCDSHSNSDALTSGRKKGKFNQIKKIRSKNQGKPMTKEKIKIIKSSCKKDFIQVKIKDGADIVGSHETDGNPSDRMAYLSGNDEKQQVCRYCSKKFRDSKESKEHYEFHRNEVLTCDTCSKVYTGRSALLQHKRRHYKVPCEFCGMIMAKDYIRKHVKARHSNWKKECPICHVVLTGHDYFRVHVSRHSQKKKYKCGICKREFASEQGRDGHVRGHDNVRPYKCRYCDQTFTILKTRSDHECLHTGARPYECPLCDKTFIQKSNWKSHFLHNHREHKYNEWSKKVIFKSTSKTS